MKNLKLLMLLVAGMFAIQASRDERIVVPKRSDAIVYNCYDSITNGIKGGIFAAIATPCTLGLYAAYADIKFGAILLDRLLLETSSATHFGIKTREQMENETAFREITNRGAKAAISTALVVGTLLFPSYVLRLITSPLRRR